ncbi:hypothetical protein HK097_008403 [Rhizophlyctis rosea]|uniref:Uncharacterized protein n=1 Tax=Rhizophlyctis rosea TaxID=64517 RepID=A0AAD5X127_9FUNG|nr:hypothetical protein HK097_008403 [Rhizophlyctis rosea]
MMPARGKMSETKLANLKKAREAKVAKRLNQYPKGEKRDAAEERFEAKVREEAEKRAQLLAKEIREKELMEAELAEFKAWKAAGKGKVREDVIEETIEAPAPKRKKAAPAASASKKPAAKATAKPAPKQKTKEPKQPRGRPRSPSSEEYEDGDPEPSYLGRAYQPTGRASIIDSLLD